MILDRILIGVLILGGALMAGSVPLTAAWSGWSSAMAPLVCTVAAFFAIVALWSRGGEGGSYAESAA